MKRTSPIIILSISIALSLTSIIFVLNTKSRFNTFPLDSATRIKLTSEILESKELSETEKTEKLSTFYEETLISRDDIVDKSLNLSIFLAIGLTTLTSLTYFSAKKSN